MLALDIVILIVKMNGYGVLFPFNCRTHKAVDSKLLLRLLERLAANNNRARLPKMVVISTREMHLNLMRVSAKHYVRLDLLAQQLAPICVRILLNVKRRIWYARKRNVANDNSTAHALCLVFLRCIFDHIE